MVDKRIENEIEHGRHLKKIWSGSLWYWETPAGQIRWKRRVGMLTSQISENMDVLELGCAVGYFTKELAKTNAKITAIDISPEFLEIAGKNILASNVRFIKENAYDLSFDDNSFDAIIGSSILHHLDMDKALVEFYRVLRKGGCMFFTEPNMLNPQIMIQKNISFLKKALGDSPDETAFFRWGLKKMLRKNGFENINIFPFDFLHPSVPKRLVSFVEKTGYILEKVPLINELSGSLFFTAQKPI